MAVRFDADTDRISYTASNPPDPAAGSTLAWWTYLSVDRNDFSCILRLHFASGGSTTINVATAGDGTTPNIFTVGGSVSAATGLTVGAWYYLVVTISSSSSATIYVTDLATSTTTSASGTISTNGAPTGITVGGRSPSDGSEWFNGRIAYLRHWSAVLSGPERDAERVSTVPVRTTNLWSAWPLADATDLSDHFSTHHFSAGTTAVTTEAGPTLSQTVTGTALATLGALTAPATGVRTVHGSTTATLAGLAATASARRTVAGQLVAGLAGLSAAASARRTVLAQLASDLAGLSASAPAWRTVLAQLAAALAGLSGSATARRTVAGQLAAPLGFTATATGRRTRHGTAVASLGFLTALGSATGSAHDIHLTATLAPARRWAASVAVQS